MKQRVWRPTSRSRGAPHTFVGRERQRVRIRAWDFNARDRRPEGRLGALPSTSERNGERRFHQVLDVPTELQLAGYGGRFVLLAKTAHFA